MPNVLRTVLTLIAVAAVSACNIFNLASKKPGANALELQDEFNTFILPVSRLTMTVPEIFDVAKETRQYAGIGVLETASMFLYTSDGTAGFDYPFEDRTASQRTALLPHVRVIDQATTVIVLANQEGVSERLARTVGTAQYLPSHEDLRLVARRAIVTEELDPCSVYPDFLVARLLHVLLKHRLALQGIAGFEVGSSSVGYRPVWVTPTLVSQSDVETYNAAVASLADMIESDVRPYLSPFAAFGCDTRYSDIIDPEEVEAYIDYVLLPSFESYVVNTGIAGNAGEGDNDGDGSTDEELINGHDDDGDGLIDEDARL